VTEFYRALGKRTIRLHKEVPGHVANRLQAALYREVVHLISEGVVSVGDADTAVLGIDRRSPLVFLSHGALGLLQH
jgi:3-hydroxyacyl-CoA dehydrogenase